jgi:hypothetical protein
MKTVLLYLGFLFSFFAATAQVDDAQPDPKREEKIKALYVAYISQQLNLTPDEAQKFWPLHAQYEAELKSINSSNADELARQQAVLNVKKKYQNGFSKMLGTERSNNFYRQDGEFRKKLVQRLKQMRQQRKNNMPPGERPGGGRMKRQNMMPR